MTTNGSLVSIDHLTLTKVKRDGNEEIDPISEALPLIGRIFALDFTPKNEPLNVLVSDRRLAIKIDGTGSG